MSAAPSSSSPVTIMTIADLPSQRRQQPLPSALQVGVRRQPASRRAGKHRSMLSPQLPPISERPYSLSCSQASAIEASTAGAERVPIELPDSEIGSRAVPFFTNEPWLINDLDFAYNLRSSAAVELPGDMHRQIWIRSRSPPIRPRMAIKTALQGRHTRLSAVDEGQDPPHSKLQLTYNRPERPISMIDRPRWNRLEDQDTRSVSSTSTCSTAPAQRSPTVSRMSSLSIASSFRSEATSILSEMVFDEEGNLEFEGSSPLIPDVEYTFTNPALMMQENQHGLFRKQRNSLEQLHFSKESVTPESTAPDPGESIAREDGATRYYAKSARLQTVNNRGINYEDTSEHVVGYEPERVRSPTGSQAKKFFGRLRT